MGKMSLSKLSMAAFGVSAAGMIVNFIAGYLQSKREDEYIDERVNERFEEFMNNFEIINGEESTDEDE